MAITFAGGIITVVDGTSGAPSNFEAIYQADVAGVWGVVTKQGLYNYRIDANVEFGDGTNPWYFKDAKKNIIITGWVQNNDANGGEAHFQLGELSATGNPVNGCSFSIPTLTDVVSTYYPQTGGNNCGNCYFYACYIYIPTFWRFYGTNSEIMHVQNCIVESSLGFRLGGTNSKNTGNKWMQVGVYGVTSIEPTPLIDSNEVYDSEFGMYFKPSYSGDARMQDMTLHDNTFAVKMVNDGDKYIDFVDCQSDEWTFSYGGSTDRSVAYRRYSYSFSMVKASDRSVNLELPSYGIFDTNKTLEHSGTTDQADAYSESFESSFGRWSTNASEGGDSLWKRKSGATGSGGTGPDSASDGTTYIYCETSSPNYPLKNFDLFIDGASITSIEFDYMLRWNADVEAVWTTEPQIEIARWDGLDWEVVTTIIGTTGTTSVWASQAKTAISQTSRIRIRATSGKTPLDDDVVTGSWNGDMALDKVVVEETVQIVSGLELYYGHYMRSLGSTPVKHGGYTHRVRKYGMFPFSSVFEISEATTVDAALTIDTTIVLTEVEADAVGGVVINKSLERWNIAEPADPTSNDVSTWLNGNVVISQYTVAPYPNYFSLNTLEITASSSTVSDYATVDVSSYSTGIATGDYTIDYSVFAALSTTTNTSGLAGLSFRDAAGAEISAVTVSVTTAGAQTLYTVATTLIPVGTTDIRITQSVTTTGTNIKLFTSVMSCIVTNSNYSGYSINIDCGGNTLDDTFHYIQSTIAKNSDVHGMPAIKWHNMLKRAGEEYITTGGTYHQGAKNTLYCGVDVTNYSEGTIAQLELDNSSIFVPSKIITGKVEGILPNSRILVENVTKGSEVANTVIIGTTWELDYTPDTTFSEGDLVKVSTGLIGKMPLVSYAIASDTLGFSVLVNQVDDEVYITNAIDGTTVIEFASDFPNVEVDVNDADGQSSWKRLYAWFSAAQTTEQGIRTFFGGLVAEDGLNYRVVTSLIDLHVQNTSATPVFFLGSRLYRDDDSILISAGGGGVHVDSRKAYLATSDQATLNGIKSKVYGMLP